MLELQTPLEDPSIPPERKMMTQHRTRAASPILPLVMFLLGHGAWAEDEPAPTHAISVASSSYTAGTTVNSQWTAPASHSTTDWVGFFKVGAANTAYSSYKYVPAGASGALSFVAPMDAGTYELRYLLNNGYTVAATSSTFSVQFEPPQELQYNGHDYTYFQEPKTWIDAQRVCAELGQDLVTINDSAEDTWLKQQVPTVTWWIGFNDRAKEGTWVWPDVSSGYVNWRPGEPNNTGDYEDCAVGNAPASGSNPAGRWNDLFCNEKTSFFCESRSTGPVFYQFVDYTASDTLSATRSTTDVSVNLEPGQLIEVGTCGLPGVFSTNDTYLRLLGPDGLEVTSNDDACKGSGSRLRYRVPACGAGTYVIQAGCFESGSCGGRLGYTY